MFKTISQASAECLQSFTDCLDVEPLGKEEWAENRLADFNLWVSGTGASAQKRASLDSRLALEPQAREVILALLNQLTEAVGQCKALALSKMMNQDEQQTDEQPVAVAQKDRPSSAWSDVSSDEELEMELRLLASRSPLDKQMKAIELMLDQLARIALAVRRSGRRSRLQKADQQFKPEDHNDLQTHLVTILLAQPESSGGPFQSFDQKNPSLLKEQTDPARLSEIQQRLVRCNLKRRNRFLYAQRHAEKLGSGILQNQHHIQPIEATETPPDASKELVEVPVTSEPLPIKEKQPDRKENVPANPTIRTGTSASAVSDALALQQMHKAAPAPSTVMSKTVLSLKYPHPPKVGDDVLIFKCPCCCQALPRIFSEGQKWKKHLAHDLSPYTCILPDCIKPETLFATKESWRTHLLNEHHSSEHWICFSCRDDTRFHEENAFRQHIIEFHATSIPQDDIPLLADISKRSMPMSIEACPLCNWVEVQTAKVDEDVLLDHIAKDVHSFSLRSLPWADDNGKEADKIMTRSKSKVRSWLEIDILSNESLEEAKEADAPNYFQHTAYFADSSATSTSSEDKSVISMERNLEELKQMDDSLSFKSTNEARSEHEANAMDISDMKPPQSQTASDEEIAQIWRNNTVNCIKQLHSNGMVLSVTFSHDSSLIASGSAQGIVQLWCTNTGDCIQTLHGHTDWVRSVALSHNSSLIASGSDDKTIRIWNVTAGGCIQTLYGHDDWVRSIAFSHNSSLIASGSKDCTIRIWDVTTGNYIRTLQGHYNYVHSVAFSHNSLLIVSGSWDDTIRIWDVTTGNCIQILQGHGDDVNSVVFSHNSSLIASGAEDRTIRIWDATTGDCIQTLRGHDNYVYSVAFSYNSLLIVSGSEDHKIRIWDVTTGDCIQIIQGHDERVTSVAFSHNSLLIASGSWDKTIRLWSTHDTI
ncbi:WD40-repeat-containing domain protein [Trichoderma sp. SZMC 28013]